MYDPDSVALENLESSFAFSKTDLGKTKVKALSLLANRWESDLIGVEDYYIDEDPLTPILVMAVDSLAARKYIWENAKGKYRLYIDMRTGFTGSAVYSWTDEPSEMWLSTLDMEDAAAPCGAKSVAHNCLVPVAITAGIINNYSYGDRLIKVNMWEQDVSSMICNKDISYG